MSESLAILYFFKSPYGKYLLNLASPGGAGRNKTLGQENFLDLDIKIPKSLESQQKNSNIIATWDKAIELKGKLIEYKKLRINGLKQILLTSKKKHPKFDGKWEDGICSISSGKLDKTLAKLYQ